MSRRGSDLDVGLISGDKEKEGRGGEEMAREERKELGTQGSMEELHLRAPRGQTAQFKNTPCCTHGPGAPGHSTASCANTATVDEGRPLGLHVTFFSVPEALKRHTQGHMSNKTPFSIDTCCRD